MKARSLAILISLIAATSLLAQGALRMPEASPAATVGQTIGITNVQIAYHRPAVNKRKIFGGLVPYGVLWRTGANENTTITFSTPVKIEGQALPAGTYGLYMIPNANQWTVVFSKFAADWGTYNYDPAEDALRVNVTPQNVADNQERMEFSFEDLTNNSANAVLRWATTRVPVKIEVDVPTTVRASIQDELRGGKHWDANAWAAAARFELRNGNPDKALEYANHAMELGITTTTLRTKAAVLEKKGDKTGAAELRARAKQNYSEAEEIGSTAFEMIGSKKYDDAIAYLNNFLAAHPNSPNAWRAYYMIGQAYGEKGDLTSAKTWLDKAMAAAHDEAERVEVQDTINALGAEAK